MKRPRILAVRPVVPAGPRWPREGPVAYNGVFREESALRAARYPP